MTKRWKLKTNSSNILLVLITLILVKAEWVEGDKNGFWEITNDVEVIEKESQNGQIQTYVGNDEIAEYFFHSSVNNNSIILDGINNCLDHFQLITCVKMLLLSRVNDVLNLVEEPEVSQKDIRLLNGIFVFKIKNETNTTGFSETNDYLSLDEEIGVKVKNLFRKRSLLVNLLPNFRFEIEPDSGQRRNDFICFKFSRIRKELDSEKGSQNEGRKRKSGGMSMMMMVPQLIMLGLMPFTLASLKAMVMNAVMINMMALNGAIFMTIRNLVFGPRQGDNVKYVNYGYSKDRQTQSPKPVLIIHSPAAFVKQPPVHKKQVYGHYSHQSYFPESYYKNSGSSYHNEENTNDYEYYYIQQVGNSHNNRKEEKIQRRNESEWKKRQSNATGQGRVQNKNIYQRKFKQEIKDRRQILGGSFYKTGTNFDYSGVNLKRREPTVTRYQTINHRRGGENGKSEFKPSPQWDSVGGEKSS